MKALLFGVEPEALPVPDTDNHLLKALARTPARLVELPDPGFLLSDWVVTSPRLTGICGSESKQVLADWQSTYEREPLAAKNPMMNFISMPHVLGHEVVAVVDELGPDAEGIAVGDRVVLNPWLSCGPRGIAEWCPACQNGDFSQCWNLTAGPLAPAIHTGMSSDASGGMADRMPAHDSMLFKVPDSVPDEMAVWADPFSVSLHGITRHSPPPGGKVLVYGAGALGTCAIAILKALYPDVEVAVIARFEAQAQMARKLGADLVLPHEPRIDVIAAIADWSGGVLQASDGLPMAWPGGVDVVYDTVGAGDTFEVGARVLKARSTLVKLGVHGASRWEDTPLYFKECSMVGSNAFGFETVEGVRKHGIQHYLDLCESGRIDLSPALTHTFRLDDWRDAFTALAQQDVSGAIKVAFDFR